MTNSELSLYKYDDICHVGHVAHSKIEMILFCIVLLEIFFMGSGRLIQLGPLTLRMMLFSLCIFLVFHNFIYGKLHISIFSIMWVLTYLFLICLATLLGYINLSQPIFIYEDIKPLFFFLMLLYFEMMIVDITSISLISRLIKITSIIMAVLYLSLIALLYNRVISFNYIYSLLSISGEFMFRGEFTLFYKGFIYLNIGLLFYLFSCVKRSYLSIFILSVSIFLTFTKGFIIAISPIILLGFYLKTRKKLVLITAAFALIVMTALFFRAHMEILGDKSQSDMVRLVTAKQVSEDINIISFFIGHGFGQGVPESPVHMETSLVEIFHKQGILGLSFWLALLCVIIHYYRNSILVNNHDVALPFLLSSLFIYIQSLTNPFINNPIGMSFLLLSLVSLRKLSSSVSRPNYG